SPSESQSVHMDPKVAVALTLSLVGGLSTSLGALLAILNHAPNNRTLGILQGFATGLMLSMSFFDLAYDAVNAIGFLKGNLWFFAGALLFSAIADIFPEPECSPPDENDKETVNSTARKELMMRHRRRVIFSVIVTAVVAGVSLQNFPVGTAAFLGTAKGFRVGLNLVIAIALHYIPEGYCCSSPCIFCHLQQMAGVQTSNTCWFCRASRCNYRGIPISEQLKSRNIGRSTWISGRSNGISDAV
uniref:Uncharacterized protein n=1 Tax=Aegilops tauschii subsp. strangulata TaxID=200361 RepID=A0A453S9W3_AEGTS